MIKLLFLVILNRNKIFCKNFSFYLDHEHVFEIQSDDKNYILAARSDQDKTQWLCLLMYIRNKRWFYLKISIVFKSAGGGGGANIFFTDSHFHRNFWCAPPRPPPPPANNFLTDSHFHRNFWCATQRNFSWISMAAR
jgi:hypothetical protein